jgi:hypothetical protein
MFVVQSIMGMDRPGAIRGFYIARKRIDEICEEQYRSRRRNIIFAANDFKKKLRQLKQELKKFKKNIDEQTQKAFEDFKRFYNLDDQQWNLRMQSNDTIKYYQATNMSSLPTMVRDKNFPQDALVMIKKELDKYHIPHIKYIYLACSLESPSHYGVEAPIMMKNNDMAIHLENRQSGRLELNKDLWEKCDEGKRKFICISMVAELIKRFSIVPKIINFFWARLMRSRDKYDWCGVIIMQDRMRVLSLLSASLRDVKTACILQEHAANVINDQFTLEDYRFLREVAWRQKLLAELQNYKRAFQGIESIIHSVYRGVHDDEFEDGNQHNTSYS